MTKTTADAFSNALVKSLHATAMRTTIAGAIAGAITAGIFLGPTLRAAGAAAKEPPAALLATLDNEVDGEAVVRAAASLFESYGDHSRAGEAAELVADYRYILGEYKTAARYYADAAQKSVGTARTRQLLGRGRALLAGGDYAGARGVFEHVLARAPEASEARLGLADAALLAGEEERAAGLYSQVLDAPPDAQTPLALAQRLRALDALGRKDEALVTARQLIEEYPRAVQAPAARDRVRDVERREAFVGEPNAQEEATARTADGAESQPDQPETQSEPSTATRRIEVGVADDAEKAEERSDAPAPTGAYSLQLGAFSNRANAQDLARQAQELGVADVRVEEEVRGERTFYRVRTGSFADLETAEAEALRLRDAHGLRSQVVTR